MTKDKSIEVAHEKSDVSTQSRETKTAKTDNKKPRKPYIKKDARDKVEFKLKQPPASDMQALVTNRYSGSMSTNDKNRTKEVDDAVDASIAAVKDHYRVVGIKMKAADEDVLRENLRGQIQKVQQSPTTN
jgi:hypothetical protein